MPLNIDTRSIFAFYKKKYQARGFCVMTNTTTMYIHLFCSPISFREVVVESSEART